MQLPGTKSGEEESPNGAKRVGAAFVAGLVVLFLAVKLNLEVFSAVAAAPELRDLYFEVAAKVQNAIGAGTAALAGFALAALALFLLGCQIGTKRPKVPAVALLLPLLVLGSMLAFAPEPPPDGDGTPEHGPSAETPPAKSKPGHHAKRRKGSGSRGGNGRGATQEKLTERQEGDATGEGSVPPSARSSSEPCGCANPCGCQPHSAPEVVPEESPAPAPEGTEPEEGGGGGSWGAEEWEEPEEPEEEPWEAEEGWAEPETEFS